MANWAFKNKATAETLRDMVEAKQRKATRLPSSLPMIAPQFETVLAFHVQTEIAAASVNETTPTSNVYDVQLCDVYQLSWDSANSEFDMVAMTDLSGTTVQAWVVNPGTEAIPVDALVWGLPTAGSRDGVRVYLAMVWPC